MTQSNQGADLSLLAECLSMYLQTQAFRPQVKRIEEYLAARGIEDGFQFGVKFPGTDGLPLFKEDFLSYIVNEAVA